MTINDRVKAVRTQLELSREKFGNAIGVSGQVIKNLEYGLTDAKPLLIQQIVRHYNVNERWLRTGEGEMFIDLTEDLELTAFVAETISQETDDFRKRLITALSKLTTEEWAVLEKLAAELVEKEKDGG